MFYSHFTGERGRHPLSVYKVLLLFSFSLEWLGEANGNLGRGAETPLFGAQEVEVEKPRGFAPVPGIKDPRGWRGGRAMNSRQPRTSLGHWRWQVHLPLGRPAASAGLDTTGGPAPPEF